VADKLKVEKELAFDIEKFRKVSVGIGSLICWC
jgi:hypothetical protein